MKAIREAFGDVLLELGEEFPDLYVVDADIGKSCKTVEFQKKFPNQHVNVGIAEQNAAGVAAGLATLGKTAIISTYAIFGSLRMAEQIRQEACYPNLNVKVMCSHGGLTPANDGASHQSIEDMGVMRTIPNMTVIAPADYYSAKKLIREAVKMHGPVYMRFTRDAFPFVYSEKDEFEIGKAVKLADGDEAVLIVNGDVMAIAQMAHQKLTDMGKCVRLLDMHTIKPIDKEAVLAAIHESGKIVTLEDHNILNGLGSAVAEIIAEEGKGKLIRMGVQDQFGESGPYIDLLKKNGVTVDSIAENVIKLIEG